MAFHSAQGPQLGLPQMIQSRPQFGYIGALLVWPTIGLRAVTVGFTALLSLVGALAATKNFLGNFNNFLLILYLFIPWTAGTRGRRAAARLTATLAA
jgi:purine-cytosine permease-like protein